MTPELPPAARAVPGPGDSSTRQARVLVKANIVQETDFFQAKTLLCIWTDRVTEN